MGMTGGKSIAAVVGSSTSLLGSVNYAAQWFENRVRLFVDDDIWPVLNCRTGFYTDLRELLRESPHRRMAVSTHSRAIAQCAGPS